ncbi:FMN-dependent NADH-azoreductase [Serratia marcescens]|nr:FMN-dependent NADH-azoreductase [Serratia marcescens]BEM76925.1 FMN-dependent NADH-azoreductase [Serratia marcescens]
MKILHIDSSASIQASVTRRLSSEIVKKLNENGEHTTAYLDLDKEKIPHLSLSTEENVHSKIDEKFLNQFLDSDILVLGVPMYNLSIPSSLKSWIDKIVVPGVTLHHDNNVPVGLIKDKKMYLALASGGIYGENDPREHQESYLKSLFSFLGISDIKTIRANGLSLPHYRLESIREALEEITKII